MMKIYDIGYEQGGWFWWEVEDGIAFLIQHGPFWTEVAAVINARRMLGLER